MVSYYQVLVLTYIPTLILEESHDKGTSMAMSCVMTCFEQMPCVISGSDMSHLMEIITHMVFLNFTCRNLRETMHGVPRMCEVIIELYHI